MYTVWKYWPLEPAASTWAWEIFFHHDLKEYSHWGQILVTVNKESLKSEPEKRAVDRSHVMKGAYK